METALRQQEALTEFVEETKRLVVKTAILEEAVDEWPPPAQRQAQLTHSGMIWLSGAGASLSRVVTLSEEEQ